MINIREYGAIPNGVYNCSSAINAALIDGDILVKDGVFSIASSLKIPSNRTIYGKNAKILLANNSFDNIFRSSDFVNGNENINIIGQGNFLIDGNAVNNFDSYITNPKRSATGYKNVLIQLYKVNGFAIKNLTIADHGCHTIHLNQSAYGELDNLYCNHRTVKVNQDFIDILWGCHDISINNINGCSLDDFWGMFQGVNGDCCASYASGFNVGDIYNIAVNVVNIKNSLAGRFPAIIGGNGNKIHDITINNVKSLSSGSFIFSNYGSEFSGTPPTVDDVYNITGDNIEINNIYDNAVFSFGQNMKNCTFTNVVNNSGKPMVSKIAGTQQNISINGVII